MKKRLIPILAMVFLVGNLLACKKEHVDRDGQINIFKEYLDAEHKCFNKVIFAIPNGRDGNLESFKEVFKIKFITPIKGEKKKILEMCRECLELDHYF